MLINHLIYIFNVIYCYLVLVKHGLSSGIPPRTTMMTPLEDPPEDPPEDSPKDAPGDPPENPLEDSSQDLREDTLGGSPQEEIPN